MDIQNLKVAFLGDSITEGYGTTAPDKCFHQILKHECGLKEAYNCGIGGTRIAKQTNFSTHFYDLYFALRVDILPKDLDLMINQLFPMDFTQMIRDIK